MTLARWKTWWAGRHGVSADHRERRKVRLKGYNEADRRHDPLAALEQLRIAELRAFKLNGSGSGSGHVQLRNIAMRGGGGR